MLKTLRAYGTERLAEAGEHDAAAATLAGYALRVAEKAMAGWLAGAEEVAAARWLDAEPPRCARRWSGPCSAAGGAPTSPAWPSPPAWCSRARRSRRYLGITTMGEPARASNVAATAEFRRPRSSVLT